MKHLPALLFVLVLTYGKAQLLTNGDFEAWTPVPADEPMGWDSFNREFLYWDGIPANTKVPGQTANGIKLETVDIGVRLAHGMFSHTHSNPFAGVGGIPYTDQPTHITGYYKCSLQPGDSALLVVVFKKNGVVISSDIFRISGIQNTFTAFSFPLKLASAPDSVIIEALSSDVLTGTTIAGSTITFDELAFTGPVTMQPIPGGNFDNWATYTHYKLNNWLGRYQRSTDSYNGNYAALLETRAVGAAFANAQMRTRYSYTGMQDTLVFYYKYAPQGADSALTVVNLTKGAGIVGDAAIALYATATYTRVEVPVSATQAPDSITVAFISSAFATVQNIGSKLYIDDVFLKSSPLNTSIRKFNPVSNLLVYPNPASQNITFSFTTNGQYTGTFTMVDVIGRITVNREIFINEGCTTFIEDVSGLAEGVYYYSLSADGNILATGNFIKK